MIALKFIPSLIKSTAIAIGVIVTTLIMVTIFTHQGIEFLIDYANQSSKHSIVLQDIKGTLASGLYAQSILIQEQEGLSIEATQVALSLDITSLLLGNFTPKP